MSGKTCALALLLVALPAQAQQELLRAVPSGQAQRLEEYNAVFLQEELYFASRHRIVQADVDVLRAQQDITVTPFPDVAPIRILHEGLTNRGENAMFWRGRFGFEGDRLFQETGVGIPVYISMFAWDLDENGSALNSSENRFEFSPAWEFDADGDLITQGDVIATTPPPRTSEEIERHRRLKRLDKRAFYSARAVFNVPRGSKYVLRPLRYTPRYSVIYEITPDTTIPIRIDRLPGEPDTRTAGETAVLNQYQEFVENLPEEEGKQIRGDIR